MSTVLVVDDDVIVTKILAMNLESCGYEVITACNGKEGLVSALKNDPDAILLDIMMPVMNGLEMLEELRSCSDVPVIIVSAYGGSEYVERARKLGIECFINKPFKIETLKATLDLVCAASTELLA